MRLFIAINLPPAERQRLFDATSPLRTGSFPVRWVLPESMHLTVRFLGEVAADTVDPVRQTLGRVAERHEPVELSIGGVGAFPNLRRPRVLWIGVDGGDALIALQKDVESAMTAIGFEPEQRQWTPHLTLGRARTGARPQSFSGLAAVAGSIRYEATAKAGSIDLMRSHLARDGARYERILQAALRGPGRHDTAAQEAAL